MKDKKILAIEPDFESLKSLSRFLLDAEFEVITAYDGEEGLRKAKTENPDLVILEPRLSKLDGFDLCSIITKDFERKIPVIILTEFFQDFKAEILHTFGAAAYFRKPYDKEELFHAILDLLKEGEEEKVEVESEDSRLSMKTFPEKQQIRSELSFEEMGDNGNNGNGRGGNGSNGNGNNDNVNRKQLENLISSFNYDVRHSPQPSTDNKGNGSQIQNGRKHQNKNIVDDMLKDIMSEFGLASKKKTSLKKDIRALDDFNALR